MKISRLAYKVIGLIALVLAGIGAVLPLMPTTIFVIIAAWAFTRGSPTLDAKLRAHPKFGPLLVNWETYGAISRPAKAAAVIGMVTSLAVLILLVKKPIVLGVSALFIVASAAFVLSRPSPPAFREEESPSSDEAAS